MGATSKSSKKKGKKGKGKKGKGQGTNNTKGDGFTTLQEEEED